MGLEGAEVLPSLAGNALRARRRHVSRSFPIVGVDVPADFYESLGHDAGSLVRKAWAHVGGVSGAAANKDDKLRADLPQALADVETPLETTDVTGFAGKRRLLRHLTIREAP